MKSIEFISEASIFDERKLKNTHWESPQQTIRWLKENGFEYLNEGYYAAVFAKPGHNRVVKISTVQDKCWVIFAQYAQSITNNPHLPKIPWIKRYQGTYNNHSVEFFITIIERLAPLTDIAISKITDPGVLYGLLFYTDLGSDTRTAIEGAVHRHPNMDPDSFVKYDAVMKYRKHPFVNAIIEINRLSTRCMKDLHSSNLMVRKDGTIVIIDPLAGPG